MQLGRQNSGVVATGTHVALCRMYVVTDGVVLVTDIVFFINSRP